MWVVTKVERSAAAPVVATASNRARQNDTEPELSFTQGVMMGATAKRPCRAQLAANETIATPSPHSIARALRSTTIHAQSHIGDRLLRE
jgi:hypothetical protein